MKRGIFLFIFLAFCCFAGISVDWNLPEIMEELVKIYPATINVDGIVSKEEWARTSFFSIRSINHLIIEKRKWTGPKDSGMEFYFAWDKNGIYLAAIVSDDEIFNEMPVEKAWEQDCIEFFVDGRPEGLLMKQPYSIGCYQIFVKPPVDGKTVQTFSQRKIKGLIAAGIKTQDGYNVELFIPWSAFPEIKNPQAGVFIGLQAILDDYDQTKGQTVIFSYLKKRNLYREPNNFVRCILSQDFQPSVNIECPSLIFEKSKISLAIEGCSLNPLDSISATIENKDGKIIERAKPKITGYSEPWKNAIRASFSFNTKKVEDDLFFVSILLKQGKNEYTIKKPVLFLGNVSEEIISEIKKADVRSLSQVEPFKALSYVAVGSCYEKIKRAIETDDRKRLVAAIRESAARLDVLKKGKLKETSSLLDFLVLTENPQSQVVVEYPSLETTTITFYWASIPLVSVRVQKFADEKMAQDAAREKMDGLVDLLEDRNAAGDVVIAGLPARASSWAYMTFYFNISGFNPDKQVLIVFPLKKQIYVIDTEKIDCADVESVVMMEDVSKNIKNAVQSYISSLKKKPQIIGLEEAMGKNSVLVASRKLPEIFSSFRCYKVNVVKHSIIRVPYKDMLVSSSHPSRWVAEEAVKLVIRKRPVQIQDVEKIRKTLVNDFAFSTRSSEKERQKGFVYCGDLHAHSNFSDGYLSPVGITLQSMACFMDFFALTDHNTVEGALIVSKLLQKYGFDYTFIVGQEITTKSFHFNAYPLKKTVPWEGYAEDIISLAKQQSALVQWNHPGWTNSQWELQRLDNPLTDTSLDAWEHIPLHYYQWKKEDILPPLVGSTDTHDGTFSKPERTIIFSSTLSEKEIIEAIKDRRSVIVYSGSGSDYMYGENLVIGEIWDFLLEAETLKQAKQNQIKRMLKNTDLAGLLMEKYEKPSTGR